MNKVINLLKTHQHAIKWTICYVFIMWFILYFLFNFNMFNSAQWYRLFHSQLRGFPGFVFGILILSALPLYVATTVLITRTKKPLITIQKPKITIPKIFKSSAPSTPAAPVAPPSETPTLGPDESDKPIELPADMPHELRHAFIRARSNIGSIQTSVFNTPNSTSISPETAFDSIPAPSSDTIPLPPDFDIDVPNFDDETSEFMPAPIFTDITFDTQSDSTPPDTNVTPESDTDISRLTEHLNASGQTFTIDQDIVITDTHAIATHSDSNFWVTDSENWFAAGQIRPSPVKAAIDIATQHNKKPAIYLQHQNILDIEKLISEWESMGILVITDLTTL